MRELSLFQPHEQDKTMLGRTFRVFVSSTFDDFILERNALQETVFPKLQILCKKHNCQFQAVDLRWGVSEEAALDQQTMNICLTELKRCQTITPRPNFIILIGDRYGWVPLPPQIEASEFREIKKHVSHNEFEELCCWYTLDTNAIPAEYVLRARQVDVFEEVDYECWKETEKQLRVIFEKAIKAQGWSVSDRRRIKYECSATHQEILEGATKLPNERKGVFAFFRNIKNIENLSQENIYYDGNAQKVRDLKEMVAKARGVTTYSYDLTWPEDGLDLHIKRFIIDAYSSLLRVIKMEIAQMEQIDELTNVNRIHEEFGAKRCRFFVGQKNLLDAINQYINGKQNTPMFVFGPSGSGKSALMAKAAECVINNNKKKNLILFSAILGLHQCLRIFIH